MDLPDYAQFSKWLSLFGQNMALATGVVVLYAAIRPVIAEQRPRLAALAIGVIFGLSAIVSMSTPFHYAAGVRLDMRDVFVLVGSLSGGAIGAAVTVSIAIAYRLYLGGAGTPIGVGGIIIFAAVGLVFARRYGPRVRELGIGPLLLIGFVAAFVDNLYGRTVFGLMGLPYPPLEELIALLLLVTVGTAFLDVAMNMTHYRVWQRTQRQLFNIFETTSDLIWETNVEERFTLMSGRVKAIMGYEPSEIVGRTGKLFDGRWQDEETEVAYRKAVETRQPFNELKYSFNAKDGTQRIVSISGRPAFEPGGRFAGFRGIAANVMDQQLAKAALEERDAQLRESRAHLAVAQSLARVASGEVDLITGSVMVDDSYFDLLGLDRSNEASYAEMSKHVHPDDRAQMDEIFRRAQNGEDTQPVDFRFIRLDGATQWLRRVAEIRRDGTGQPIKLIATYLDITDSKKAALALQEQEIELRQSREHLALAQQVAALGSVERDLLRGTLYWSDEIYRILGLDSATTKPDFRLYREMIHPDDRAVFDRAREDVSAGIQPESAEIRIIRPDGQLRWINRQIRVFKDDSGAVVKSVSTLQDVTERRNMEEDLRRSRENLARAQLVAMVGSGEINLRTRKIWWSDEWYRILGLDPATDQADYAHFISLVHPQDRALAERRRDRNAAGLDNEPAEFRIYRPDGELRWVHIRTDIIDRSSDGGGMLLATLQDITDRKRLEEELRLSREHLALAQRVGKIGSGQVDLPSGKLAWSEQWYEILGLDPASVEPSDDQYLARVHPDDVDLVLRRRERNFAALDNDPVEYRIVRPDGAIRWIHVRTDKSGVTAEGTGKIIATIQDITDRKRMELELAEREAQLRTSREHLAVAQRLGMIGSSEVDIPTNRSQWTDALFALLGLDPTKDEASGERFLQLVHPEDRAVAAQRRERGLSGQANEATEYRIIRPDGEVRWVQVRTDVIYDDAEEPAKMISTVQDVTYRKAAEIAKLAQDERLRISGEHLAQAQRVGMVGSSEFRPSTGETWWSDELHSILGRKPGFTTPLGLGEAFLACIHPDDVEMVRERYKRGALGQRNDGTEYRIVRPDGEVRWIYAQSEVVRDSSQAILTVIGTMHDITERKQEQQERVELERQLAQSQKLEAIGKLTGGVAHDFNNLLTVIIGRLEMLDDELEDRPVLRNWVRICANAAGRGATLTRSMLAFSRQQPLKPIDIDVATALNDMIELLPRTLGETVRLQFKSAPDLWRCRADVSQMQNALLNLALNARDAMPRGGTLTVEVGNARLDEDYVARNVDAVAGEYVMLSVSDNGAGMSPEVAARAFDPFFSTKDPGKGTGLGLSMVYGFARQSGGHAKIYSELGIGTTVRLYLPRSRGTMPSAEIKPDRPIDVAGDQTILVVEDDDAMRDLAVAQLGKLGYRALAAADGARGLRLIEQHEEITLLLTDLTLPGGMTGREMALLAMARRPNLRTIYMSGYTEDAVIQQGRLDPGVRLLQKPFGQDELADHIRAALLAN